MAKYGQVWLYLATLCLYLEKLPDLDMRCIQLLKLSFMEKISRDIPKWEVRAPLIWSLAFAGLSVKPIATGSDFSLAVLFVLFSFGGLAIYLNYVFGYVNDVFLDGEDVVFKIGKKSIRLPITEIREIRSGIAKPPTLIIAPIVNSQVNREIRFQPSMGRFFMGYSKSIRELMKKVKDRNR